MSDSGHDDEFEAYLQRRVPVDKRTNSLEQLEPPEELDRIVIGEARKAIQGTSSVHFYRAPKWALPVALAAAIVTSFATMVGLGVRELRKEMGTQTASTAETIATEQIARASNAPAPTAVPPVATTPWPPTPMLPSAASGSARRTDSAEPVESDKTRTRLARTEAAAKRSRTKIDADSVFTDAPGEARLASLENAPLRSMVLSAQRPLNVDKVNAVENRSDHVSEQNASILMDLTPALASMASSARAALEGIPDPAARLEQIEKLRSDGHSTQAERAMKRFRETYPDYPTPADSSHQ
jgi:hypothetical protein